ncbi:cold-inducible RNA-binding protein-like protein [Haematococcus lacustris]
MLIRASHTSLAAARRVFAAAPKTRLSTTVRAAEGYSQPSMSSTKLYVGNLSWDARREDLEELFSKFGTVEDAFVANDRETGRSRGFGFVTMAEGASDAVAELDNSEFMGRSIRVNEAQPQGDRPAGGRGGGRGGGGSYGGRSSYGGGERSERGYGGGERSGGYGGERSGGYGGERSGGYGGGGGGYSSGGRGGGRGGSGGRGGYSRDSY